MNLEDTSIADRDDRDKILMRAKRGHHHLCMSCSSLSDNICIKRATATTALQLISCFSSSRTLSTMLALTGFQLCSMCYHFISLQLRSERSTCVFYFPRLNTDLKRICVYWLEIWLQRLLISPCGGWQGSH